MLPGLIFPTERRTWLERLMSLPWRPWVADKPLVFRPMVWEHDVLGFTEMVLEDTQTVWHPMQCSAHGHVVDLGYSNDGRLIAIRVWQKVAELKR